MKFISKKNMLKGLLSPITWFIAPVCVGLVISSYIKTGNPWTVFYRFMEAKNEEKNNYDR